MLIPIWSMADGDHRRGRSWEYQNLRPHSVSRGTRRPEPIKLKGPAGARRRRRRRSGRRRTHTCRRLMREAENETNDIKPRRSDPSGAFLYPQLTADGPNRPSALAFCTASRSCEAAICARAHGSIGKTTRRRVVQTGSPRADVSI